MATSGIMVGFLVAVVACAVIMVIPNPENERATRLQHRIWGIFHRLSALLSDDSGAGSATPPRVLSAEELGAYDGSPGSPGLYMALLGEVFDVGKGERHYAPGMGYHGFAARDASKAFITGDFTEGGLIPDVSDLSPQEMLGLRDWVEFFKEKYIYVGRLAGHFYDAEGIATPSLVRALAAIKEGERLKEDESIIQKRYPHCNMEWKQATGLRVWCSNRSGGIQRDWVGVPRQLFSPGSNKWRCACVNEADLHNPHLRLYGDCDPQATACKGDS